MYHTLPNDILYSRTTSSQQVCYGVRRIRALLHSPSSPIVWDGGGLESMVLGGQAGAKSFSANACCGYNHVVRFAGR